MASDDMLVMRLPGDVKTALRKMAKTQDKSMSNLVVGILSGWLVARGALRAKPAAKKAKRK